MIQDNTLQDRSYGLIPFHLWNGLISFLLVQEKQGHWGLPKGHPEKGESEVETARREFIEESGIFDFQIIEEPSFVEQYRFERGGNTVAKTVKYFLTHVAEPRVTFNPSEISGYGWFVYDDALNIATYEESKNIIRAAKDFIEKSIKNKS